MPRCKKQHWRHDQSRNPALQQSPHAGRNIGLREFQKTGLDIELAIHVRNLPGDCKKLRLSSRISRAVPHEQQARSGFLGGNWECLIHAKLVILKDSGGVAAKITNAGI